MSGCGDELRGSRSPRWEKMERFHRSNRKSFERAFDCRYGEGCAWTELGERGRGSLGYSRGDQATYCRNKDVVLEAQSMKSRTESSYV